MARALSRVLVVGVASRRTTVARDWLEAFDIVRDLLLRGLAQRDDPDRFVALDINHYIDGQADNAGGDKAFFVIDFAVVNECDRVREIKFRCEREIDAMLGLVDPGLGGVPFETHHPHLLR
ncbi:MULTISPECIES: hypothetical protein [unclassified Mesorhizobium]|uniref:hypothetical protein n=1 Tax=unclassified Mesorhizobium TaxID=325217 RepID=UPI001FF06B14|nr:MULTISPECIES: hypothetical protein [unclassified Mesorhizobium]